MASTIITKYSGTASAVPVSGDLTQGELAVNTADKRLFTKNSGGTVVELGTNPASLALPNGTANGVLYLNGSKVATSGSALYFDGTNLGVGTTSPTSYVGKVVVNGHQSILGGNGLFLWDSTNANAPSIYAPGDSFAFKNNAGSELMRLTSTGLGIGTSSPGSKLTVLSTGSTIEAKQSSAGAATYYVMDTTVETNGKRWRFGYTGASGTTPGMFSFLNVTDNVIGPVIDSSGNLGLGLTPSAWNASHPAFQFKYNTAISSYSSNDGLELTSNGYADTATTWKYIESYSAAQYVVGGGQHAWKNAALGTAGAAITWTQAMTLDASGNLLVGTTSASGRRLWVAGSNTSYISTIQNDNSSPLGLQIYHPTDVNGTGNSFLVCVGNATNRVELRSNGGIGNYSANNVNLSDERLKNNIQYAGNYLAKICAIPVRTFKYKDQTDDLLNLGVIAQEVETVAPELVDSSGFGETPEDGVPLKAIYQTDLQYALMKCIQEQQALITQLTERITALEGK